MKGFSGALGQVGGTCSIVQTKTLVRERFPKGIASNHPNLASGCASSTSRLQPSIHPHSRAHDSTFHAVLFIVWPDDLSNGWAGPLVQFRVASLGDIEVELFDQDKPITVQNFIRYVQSGRYQNSILHRCPVSQLAGISDFVVQGGGIFVSNRGQANAILEYVPSFGDIQNEFAVGRRFSNTYATIAMAKRAGDTTRPARSGSSIS
jgi:cyclophilin family peptidyl-prolyl cis-trans isomerase